MVNLHQRDLSWDILKGILILLVVAAHAIADIYFKKGEYVWYNDIFNIIYLFHMPLFIFVSGYFAHSIGNKDFKEFISSKTKRLLLPWIVWTSIFFVIHFVFDKLPYPKDNMNGIIKYCLVIVYQNYTKIWYLICIFALSFFYYPILRYKKNGEGKWLIVSIFSVLILVSSVIFYDRMPLRTNGLQINRMSLVFALGVIYFFIKDKIYIRYALLLLALAIIACLIGYHFNGIYFVDYNIPQKMYNGVMCTIIMFSILKPLSRHIQKINGLNFLFIWCGQNSLGLYVVHMFLRLIFKISNIEFDYMDTTLDVLILSVLYMLFSILFILLAKRFFTNYTYIIGI